MATKLEKLLAKIDPSRTYDAVSARVDRAFNSFAMPLSIIPNRQEFENVLADFCCHIEKIVLKPGPGAPADREFYWVRAFNLIEKAYAPNGYQKAYASNGYQTAYTIVRTGKEGGLYKVFKKMADLMAEKYAKKQINYEIYTYWDTLSVNEKLAASDEYLHKWGHLLPNETTEGSAPRIKAFFTKVLEEHPRILCRLRRIGR